MYNKIKIKNLRGVKNLKIDDFRQFNLFVGENNSGKTTVLEGLYLLTGATNPELPLKINVFRDFPIVDQNAFRTIFNKLDVDSEINIEGELEIEIEGKIGKLKQNRSLIIKPHIESFMTRGISKIREEDLTSIRTGYSGLEPTISGLDLDLTIKDASKRRNKIKTQAILEGKEVKFERPDKYKDFLRGALHTPNNIFIGDILARLDRIQISKMIDKVVKIIHEIEPSVNDIVIGGGGIIYADIGLDRLIPVNMLGAGTLKVFATILAIFDLRNGVFLLMK